MIQWVLPSVDPAYRAACLDGLDQYVRDRVLVVDNTKTNRGVAASWNIGIRRAINMGADWLIIMSESVRFKEAGGLDLEEELRADHDSQWVDAVGLGWHLVAFRTWVLRKVGFFDENFWPAYLEDTDYLVRMHWAGLASPRRDEYPELYNDRAGRRMISGLDIYDAGTEHSIREGLVHARFAEGVEYFKAKWGAKPPGYAYQRPFDHGDIDWTWWPATRQAHRVW
jgi:hypothetical protein